MVTHIQQKLKNRQCFTIFLALTVLGLVFPMVVRDAALSWCAGVSLDIGEYCRASDCEVDGVGVEMGDAMMFCGMSDR